MFCFPIQKDKVIERAFQRPRDEADFERVASQNVGPAALVLVLVPVFWAERSVRVPRPVGIPPRGRAKARFPVLLLELLVLLELLELLIERLNYARPHYSDG
jgi:hypothetical protein